MRNSAASPSQAVAASSIGPAPAPAKICAELISGGSTKKFMRPSSVKRCFLVRPSERAPSGCPAQVPTASRPAVTLTAR